MRGRHIRRGGSSTQDLTEITRGRPTSRSNAGSEEVRGRHIRHEEIVSPTKGTKGASFSAGSTSSPKESHASAVQSQTSAVALYMYDTQTSSTVCNPHACYNPQDNKQTRTPRLQAILPSATQAASRNTQPLQQAVGLGHSRHIGAIRTPALKTTDISFSQVPAAQTDGGVAGTKPIQIPTARVALRNPHEAQQATRNTTLRNESFDLIRILAFISIVFLHLGVTVNVQTTPLAATVNAACRFAVPFFFAITGFFLVGSDVRKLLKSFSKELVFTMCAVGIYLALSTLGLWDWSGVGLSVTEAFEGQWLESFLIWNNFPLAYHLWFLFAALETLLILILWRLFRIPIGVFICLGAILLIARFSLMEFSDTISPLSMQGRSFIFMTIPSFALGMALARAKERLRTIPAPVSLLMIATGTMGALCESYIFGLQELYITSIITVVGLFALCLRCPHPFSSIPGLRRIKILARSGGMPMGIAYVIHLAVFQLITTTYLPITPKSDPSTILLVWSGCVVISLLIGYLSTAVTSVIKGIMRRAA